MSESLRRCEEARQGNGHEMRRLAWIPIGMGLLGAVTCSAQETPVPEPGAPASHVRLGVERLTLPGGERMGLAGTSYLVDAIADGLSIGPAVYASVSGQRGGFYTLGGELEWRHPILGPFGVELGLYAGGGGGGGAPQGGGLMLRPHAGVSWNVGPGSLGLSLSRVRFPNGRIDSTQLGLVATIDTTFRAVPVDSPSSGAPAGERSGLGFDRVVAVAGAYRTRSGGLLSGGAPLPSTIGTVGIRAERGWGHEAYWGIEANGAANGRVAGYAEYLATLGMNWELIPDRLDVGARVALGTGGGGGLPVGGGLLAKASILTTLRLASDQAVVLEAGFVDAPQGRFRASQGSIAWAWILDGPGRGAPPPPTRMEFAAGIEAVDVARLDGQAHRITADLLKISRFVSPHAYLSGQLQSAVSGGAGGYSAGFFGLGWRQPVFDSAWHASAELMAGAGGGGGVTSGGGLAQAMISAGCQLSPSLLLSLGAGRVQSLRRSFGSNVVDASLTFVYGKTDRAD
jgi:hypothetical protein